MFRFATSFIALMAAQAYADAIPNPAIGTVSVDTGTDAGLMWRVNISLASDGGDGYLVASHNELLWPGNQSLNNVVYTVWHDLEPSSPPRNLSMAWFWWDSPPADSVSQVSSNGTCDNILGSSCVQAVAGAAYEAPGDYEGAFNISECTNALGRKSSLPEFAFGINGPIATPSNVTNTSVPPPYRLGGIESFPLSNSSNLTAFYEAQGRMQILLLQGLPRNVLTCQIVNTSATVVTNAAVAIVAPKVVAWGLILAATVLVML